MLQYKLSGTFFFHRSTLFRCADALYGCPVLLRPAAYRGAGCNASASRNVRVAGIYRGRPNVPDLSRRAAAFVVKILNGAKPAELPIERLTISPTLLAQTDEVIE